MEEGDGEDREKISLVYKIIFLILHKYKNNVSLTPSKNSFHPEITHHSKEKWISYVYKLETFK